MSPRSFLLSDALAAYVNAQAPPSDEIVQDLIRETAALGPVSGMQIAPDQGALMTLLVELVGVSSAVEVGTFTGYSSICIARGLRPGGRLVCCDVSEEYTAIARRHWARAGLDDRIELRLAPAIETLRALPTEPTVDFAFIDADKTGYAAYFDELVPRLRTGGLIVVDNVLWSGSVAEPAADGDSDDVRALRAFNEQVAADDRVESMLLAVADGLTLARKR
jgi:caffeoyl-CoA O-methyltransferase